MFKKLTCGVVAAALLAGQSVAVSAEPVSIGSQEASEASNLGNEALGGAAIIHILLLAGLVIGVLIVTDDDDPISA